MNISVVEKPDGNDYIHVTDNVQLMVHPFGKYEVDAVSDDKETLYLVDGCGMIICDYRQVRKLPK